MAAPRGASLPDVAAAARHMVLSAILFVSRGYGGCRRPGIAKEVVATRADNNVRIVVLGKLGALFEDGGATAPHPAAMKPAQVVVLLPDLSC